MKNFKVPKQFSAYFIFVLLNFSIFFLFRIIFYFVNAPKDLIASEVAKAFFIGGRFDIRLAFLFSLPLGILFLIPRISKIVKKIVSLFYAFCFSLMVLLYFVDFGYFAYLSERLNAYIVDLAANTITSLEMVWQTYPVVWGFLALFIVGFIYYFVTKKIIIYAYSRDGRKSNYWFAFLALLVTAALVHGNVSQYPLRWSNAYFSKNTFITSLALNPVQNLFDTYKFAKYGVTFNADETRKYYQDIADFLAVPKAEQNAQTLNFRRTYQGGEGKYNVVVILTESLAYDKSSFANSELDATPRLKEFAKNAFVFNRFFTPAAGTAKGVFASITGLPDTAAVKTSSRNPLLATQHTLINDLKGYEKFYFIGGSTSWGNIRGLLSNVEGLNILEEGTYKNMKRNDVWGISDLQMFRYAVKELTFSKKPFFAFLQTSGYHRPYTIPDDHGTFTLKNVDEDVLKEFSFSGNEEYNSMRFQDYAMVEFFDEMQKNGFFENTIFIIYGDHGLTTHASKTQPQAMIDFDLNLNHTPLIIKAPNLPAGVDDKVASQVDITATIAGLLGITRTESTLGRNLFNKDIRNGAFILAQTSAPLRIGYLEDDFYYTFWPQKEGLYKYNSDDSQTNYCADYPQKCEEMRRLSQGLYEASRYIAFHNKPKDINMQDK